MPNTTREKYGRKLGAVLCCVARCPNLLGMSPWRYCPEHMPPEAKRKPQRRDAHARAAAKTDQRALSFIKRRRRPVAFAEVREFLRTPRSTTNNVLQRLYFSGKIQRQGTGLYVPAP